MISLLIETFLMLYVSWVLQISILRFNATKNHPRTQEEGDIYHKGMVYYLDKDNKLVGVLLFNNFGKLEEAKTLLKSGATYSVASSLSSVISLA